MKYRTIKLILLTPSIFLFSCGGYNEELATKLESAINNHQNTTTEYCDCVKNEGENCDELKVKAQEAQKSVNDLYNGVDMATELGKEMNDMYIEKEGKVKDEFRNCMMSSQNN